MHCGSLPMNSIDPSGRSWARPWRTYSRARRREVQPEPEAGLRIRTARLLWSGISGVSPVRVQRSRVSLSRLLRPPRTSRGRQTSVADLSARHPPRVAISTVPAAPSGTNRQRAAGQDLTILAAHQPRAAGQGALNPRLAPAAAGRPVGADHPHATGPTSPSSTIPQLRLVPIASAPWPRPHDPCRAPAATIWPPHLPETPTLHLAASALDVPSICPHLSSTFAHLPSTCPHLPSTSPHLSADGLRCFQLPKRAPNPLALVSPRPREAQMEANCRRESSSHLTSGWIWTAPLALVVVTSPSAEITARAWSARSNASSAA
jgi:hypothetical protein